MLTPKQKELLMFIHERVKETGVPPSFDEMKDALDLRSKSGIHRLITALEERGFIRRLPHRARALEILKLPESVSPGFSSSSQSRFTPEIVNKQSARHANTHLHGAAGQSVNVPVMGKIAAGVPIAAIQNECHMVEVPPEMVSRGEHFALEVNGDSMIEAGILDGDTVVIKKSNTAENGDIVVAYIVEDEEATLKRLRRKGDSIALEAANPAYETRIFGPHQIRVQGKLVGLIRRY